MDILQKDVSYFISLAEVLNVSKAAETLGIQQSGLSRALHRLESEFGQKLFHRKNNGLALTPVGEQILKAVMLTKTTWEQAFRGVIENSDISAGLLKIGFHPSFGQKYFPLIVKAISKSFPQLEFEAHTLSSSQITRKVNEREIDIGLVISQIRHPEIIQKKIGTDYVAGFQRNTAQKPSTILINPEMQLSGTLFRRFNSLKKIVIKDYEVIAQTCLETDTIGFLPKSVAQKYPKLHQIGGAYLKADVSCITHKEKMKSLAQKKIFDLAVKACLET
ncbi:MAG: LysR family transcriptional regulator [Bdellovibrio sp.]